MGSHHNTATITPGAPVFDLFFSPIFFCGHTASPRYCIFPPSHPTSPHPPIAPLPPAFRNSQKKKRFFFTHLAAPRPQPRTAHRRDTYVLSIAVFLCSVYCPMALMKACKQTYDKKEFPICSHVFFFFCVGKNPAYKFLTSSIVLSRWKICVQH